MVMRSKQEAHTLKASLRSGSWNRSSKGTARGGGEGRGIGSSSSLGSTMVTPPSTSPRTPHFFFCDSVSKSIVGFFFFFEKSRKKRDYFLTRVVWSYIVVGVSGEGGREGERDIPESGTFGFEEIIFPSLSIEFLFACFLLFWKRVERGTSWVFRAFCFWWLLLS